MMKKAYTLVELIFVIVIIGILSGVGFYSFDPHYVRNDANIVLMKLEKSRYEAMHYDKRLADSNTKSSVGCIDLSTLKDTNSSTIDQNYKFHSDITPNTGTICFDIFGRSKSENDENITISYQNKTVQLNILKNSGYIDIIY